MRVLSCVAALVLTGVGGDTPRFAPAEKSALVKTFTTSMKLATQDTTATLDGTPMPSGALGAFSRVTNESRRVQVTDRWVKVSGGRPIELDRTFDELVLNEKSETIAAGSKDEKVVESSKVSDLEGSTVRFSWNEKESKYDMAFAGKELDKSLFVGLREDLDLRSLLPAKDVAVGDAWELDCKQLNYMMSPAGNLHFHESGKEAAQRKPEQVSLSERFAENASGKATARYESIREKDGRRLAVVKVEAEIKTHGQFPDDETRRGDIELKLEGQYTWDLNANRIDAAAFTGAMKLVVSGDRTITGPKDGNPHTMSMRVELSGDVRLDLDTQVP